jgi:anti-anti-sigma factor
VNGDAGIPVVPLSGELDITRAPSLRRELLAVADNRDIGMVVDLSEVTYLDSAGLNVLFELAERLAERRLEIAVVVPAGGLIERVVSLVDLGAVARLHHSADAAAAEIRDAAEGAEP